MAKKRKTRQEKIILQLKRQLAQQRSQEVTIPTKIPVRQEAISQIKAKPIIKNPEEKKHDKSIFFYDLKLVKRDLAKSLILTLIVISFEIVLYLRLH